MPDNSKEDYLSYCNNQGVALEDFKAAFCSRCFNPTCSRSLAGQSLFEERIHTWHERLFKNPQSLPKEDPRYALISAVNFQEVPVGPIPIIGQQAALSTWLDPRDLSAAPEPPKPQPQKVSSPRVQAPEPAETQGLELIPSEPPEAPQKSTEPQAQPAVGAPRQAPLQTPFQQGVMIGNASAPQASPPNDPWAASPPQEETTTPVKVIQPGGKIRFGE
jgi:hypothetical protein